MPSRGSYTAGVFGYWAATIVALAQAQNYDIVDHPPSWYDEQVIEADIAEMNDEAGCLQRLQKGKIKFRPLAHVKGVETPIEVQSKRLGGVLYRPSSERARRFILDCRTVELLAALGQKIRQAGIATIYCSSAWRYSYRKGTQELSHHAHGKALDVVAIDGGFGYANVKSHYVPSAPHCGGNSQKKRDRFLHAFECAVSGERGFATIYNPNTDAMHRDHFHLQLETAVVEYRTQPRSHTNRRRKWAAVAGALVTLALGVIAIVLVRRGRKP